MLRARDRRKNLGNEPRREGSLHPDLEEQQDDEFRKFRRLFRGRSSVEHRTCDVAGFDKHQHCGPVERAFDTDPAAAATTAGVVDVVVSRQPPNHSQQKLEPFNSAIADADGRHAYIVRLPPDVNVVVHHDANVALDVNVAADARFSHEADVDAERKRVSAADQQRIKACAKLTLTCRKSSSFDRKRSFADAVSRHVDAQVDDPNPPDGHRSLATFNE